MVNLDVLCTDTVEITKPEKWCKLWAYLYRRSNLLKKIPSTIEEISLVLCIFGSWDETLPVGAWVNRDCKLELWQINVQIDLY